MGAYKPILTKPHSVNLFQQGMYGNQVRHWSNWNEVLKARDNGFNGRITIRSRQVGGGGLCVYDIPINEVGQYLMIYKKDGGLLTDLYYNETMPKQDVKLQGEICYLPATGLTLFYSTEPDHMRVALASSGRHAYCETARRLLEESCCHNGLALLFQLLEAYNSDKLWEPSHIIEFTTFKHPFGNLGWNTIIWEVRSY